MEDPWASPRTTNDFVSHFELSLPSSTLELPSRTLAKQRSPSIRSPWETDEGAFSEWAAYADARPALPAPAATSASDTIWAGAGAGWGREIDFNSSQTQLTPKAKEGILSPHNSLWPAATSPRRPHTSRLSRRSSARSLFRQPSPDPWASEPSCNRLDPPSSALIPAEKVVFDAVGRRERASDGCMIKSIEGVPVEASGGRDGHYDNIQPTSDPQGDRNEGTQADSQAAVVANVHVDIEEKHVKSPTDSTHSSFSDAGHAGERPDSPITSVDENCNDRPQIVRRPSAKVQELVEMFDGLARRKDDIPAVLLRVDGRQRSASRVSIRSPTPDDVSDFGDFEDAQHFDTPPLSRKPSLCGSSCLKSQADRTRSVSRSLLLRGTSTSEPLAPPPLPQEQSNRVRGLRDKLGPVKFMLDLQLVDKLFDLQKLDAEQPHAKDYSLDAARGVIKDSFTTASERRAWYRISRTGTMLKHDSGVGEDYRRVTWVASNIRQETNKVVRRWMEDGSHTGGRSSYGGGGPSVRGGAFNWDTKAELLSMDQIFGKRKSMQPSKAAPTPVLGPLSLQPKPRAPCPRNLSAKAESLPFDLLGLDKTSSSRPMNIAAPPKHAVLGWSTAISDLPTPASSRPPNQDVTRSLDMDPTGPASKKSTVPGEEGFVLPAPPTTISIVSSQDTLTDSFPATDDEEFGDMVASPPSTSRPASGLLDCSIDSSVADVSSTAASALVADPTTTPLKAVHLTLEEDQKSISKSGTQPPPATPSADMWDFSAFDTVPRTSAVSAASRPIVPSAVTTAMTTTIGTTTTTTTTTTSSTSTWKGEIDLETALQSSSRPSAASEPRVPGWSGLSTASRLPEADPAHPRTLSSSSSFCWPPSSSSAAYPHPAPVRQARRRHSPEPAPPPLRPASLQGPPPRHASASSIHPHHAAPTSSLAVSRSPPLLQSAVPHAETAPPATTRTASFAPVDEDRIAVGRIVDGLPDLSYMLVR